jgi:hypothetical protein
VITIGPTPSDPNPEENGCQLCPPSIFPQGDRFGYFSLPDFMGDPSFPEVFVKMVEATWLPERPFWLYHTGLTHLSYTLTVTDRNSGTSKTYRYAGSFCDGVDRNAFSAGPS